VTDLPEDQRKRDVPCSQNRRYDDAKAASRSAADRIAKATQDLVREMRNFTSVKERQRKTA